ncbi:MAG: WG repeat-containing protein [Lewinellaceae bacterium]|nr:WG repeat-containing protein [Phaeodactylibacter sp.]MCB9041053.1 WG repeat-containing protein [Lewinellaceae bacterium]
MRRYWILILSVLLYSTLSAQRYFPIKVDKKWGLINADGRVVLAPDYDAIGEFKRFGYAVMQRDGRVGLLADGGRELVPPEYDDIKVLDSTLIAVMDQGQWMVINLYGNVILEKGYQRVEVWNGFYLAYMQNGKWGLTDKFGNKLAEPVYDDIQSEEGHYFITTRANHLGLLSGTGREILPNEANEIRFFSDSLFFYRSGNLWGAIDFYGIRVIPAEYRAFSRISDGFIKLSKNDEQFVYSIACSRIISDGSYDDYYSFSKRYVITKKKRQLGLLDWCGNEVLPAAYNEIQAYDKKLFRVNFQGQWGVVKAGGISVIPFEYEYITPLRSRACVVKKNGLFGIVNFQGEEVAPPVYHRIELDEHQARAYRQQAGGEGEALTVLRLDEEGKIRDTSNFQKHFQVNITGNAPGNGAASESSANDYLLGKFEWFYSPREDRWGLRRLQDGEAQIEPKFHTVQVERSLGFTLVGIEKPERYEFERTTFRFDIAYGLVSNELGLLVTEMDFWDVRFEDFRRGYPVARCVFSNGRHGLVDNIGRIVRKDMAYLGDFVDGAARFSFAGRLSGSMKPERSLSKLRTYLNGLSSPSVMLDYTQYDQLFRHDASLTCEGCEWGYIDTAGQVIVPPQYTYAKDFINEVGIVECRGKWGMVNRDADVLIPCRYDGVQFLENTGNKIVRVYISEPKYGLIDTLGQLTVSAVYDEIGSFREGRLAVKRNGLWGFVDRDGLEVIPCRFREVQNFSGGLAAAKLGNGWGFVDKQGDVAVDFLYRRAGNFQNGLAWVYAEEGVGYINAKGAFVVPPRFDKGFDFSRGIARVVVNNEYGLIDTLGHFAQRPRYSEIQEFNEHGLAVVRYGNSSVRYGLAGRDGELITSLNLREIQPFSEGLAAVKYKDGYGFIDTTGRLAIPDIYSKVSPFSEGLAAVQKDGACGYINHKGEVVVPFDYSKCLDFSGGKAVVYKGIRKAGLIDRQGNLLIEPSLDRMLAFQEGRGLVRDEKYRFYYITEQAHLYDGYYEKATEFKHGVAVVQVDGKWGIINQKGIELIPPKYDKIENFEEGYAKVRIQGFNGLASLNGDLIVQPDYEYISYAGDGLFRVEQGDKIGYFDMDGHWVWDLRK